MTMGEKASSARAWLGRQGILWVLLAAAAQVRFVFITVDPERDCAEKVKKHLAIFSPDFVGLRGPPEDTEDVARAYNAFFEKVDVGSAAGYLVNHTTLVHVIDPEGQLVLAFPHDVTAEDMLADLRHLLN